jgi:hypothetical protein
MPLWPAAAVAVAPISVAVAPTLVAALILGAALILAEVLALAARRGCHSGRGPAFAEPRACPRSEDVHPFGRRSPRLGAGLAG